MNKKDIINRILQDPFFTKMKGDSPTEGVSSALLVIGSQAY